MGDDELIEPPPPAAPRPMALAWVTLLVAGISLDLVVLVAAPRAHSVTPFLVAGAAAAGAGAAGAVVQFAHSRKPLSRALRAAAIVVACIIVATASGGSKYTYGSTGDLTASVVLLSNSLDPSTSQRLEGDFGVLNEGSSTVRVNPLFMLRVSDASAHPVLGYQVGCTLAVPPPSVEADVVEIAPGAFLNWHFSIAADWSNASGPQFACGTLLFETHGGHSVRGTFSSAALGGPGDIPVWSGTLEAPAVALQVN